MKNIFLGIFISIFLVGCAGLPKNTNDTGVLYIQLERYYKAGDTPYVKYRIEYAKGTKAFYITPTKDFTIIKNLTPGSYRINSIQPVYINSGKMYRSSGTRGFSFEIVQGQITILPKKLFVQFIDYKDGTRRQSGKFIDISNDKMAEIQTNIKNLKGIENWTIGG